MHDVIGYGTIVLAILAGILLNRNDIRDLRNDLNSLRDKVESIRIEMHTEFQRFYMTLGQHDAKIEALQKK